MVGLHWCQVVNAYKMKGICNDTVLVFTTDNVPHSVLSVPHYSPRTCSVSYIGWAARECQQLPPEVLTPSTWANIRFAKRKEAAGPGWMWFVWFTLIIGSASSLLADVCGCGYSTSSCAPSCLIASTSTLQTDALAGESEAACHPPATSSTTRRRADQ